MLNQADEKLQAFSQEYGAFIVNRSETGVNCEDLKKLLQRFDRSYLEYTILIGDSDSNSTVTGAGLAIAFGKAKFFEIAIDRHPEAICFEHVLSFKTPLKYAIYQHGLNLVTTVLRNIHFLKHEFNSPTEHLAHVEHCMSYANDIYLSPGDKEKAILQMLNSVLKIRIPLINAIREDDLKGTTPLQKICDTCTNKGFLNHKLNNKALHKTIVEDAIKCAKEMCKNIGDKASNVLESTISI